MTGSPAEAGRHCYKCGREIGSDETICHVCNRAGMATPSATQYHGTIVVAIVAAVALMAFWASLSLQGIGPFDGAVTSFRSDPPDGIVVNLQVTNSGSKAGRAKCLLTARDAGGVVLRTRNTVSPPVGGSQSLTFEERIPGLALPPTTVTAACS